MKRKDKNTFFIDRMGLRPEELGLFPKGSYFPFFFREEGEREILETSVKGLTD